MEVVAGCARRSRRAAFQAVVASVAALGVRVEASADAGRTRGSAIATLDEPWYC
jgi:hypothetical protein